jgi:hypothetical protein
MRSIWPGLRLSAAAAVAAAALASCDPTFDSVVPFRCDNVTAAQCPAGYECVSNVCARVGHAVPSLVTATISDNESAFSVVPRASDAVVCWTQGLAAREPGVWARTLAADSTVQSAPRVLFSGLPNTATTLLGVTGTCVGGANSVLVGTTSIAGPNAFIFGLYSYNQDLTAFRQLPDLPTFPESVLTNFSGTHVGDQAWFLYPRHTSAGVDQNRQFLRAAYSTSDPTLPVMARIGRMPLDPILSSDSVSATDSLGSSDGSWLVVYLRSGEIRLAWLPLDPMQDATMLWLPPPLAAGTYVRAYPLGVHGHDLALAFLLPDGQWHLYWATVATPATPDGGTQMLTSRAGPAFTLHANTVRPGGFVEGDRLFIAGAIDGTHVHAWSLAWGSTDAPQVVGVIEKISTVPARRLMLTRVAGQLLVLWTERIPANASMVEYFTLLAGHVPEAGH